MLRGIGDIIGTLSKILPFEALVALGVVVVLLALPSWLRSIRVKQIKGRLRTAARARTPEEAERAVDAAFRLAGGKPRLLVDLADAAIRNGQTLVWRRALTDLDASDKLELDRMRLRRMTSPPPSGVKDPLEATVRAERLLQIGLTVAARETLDEALSRHPNDPDLLELGERLAAAEAQAGDTTQAT